MKKWNYTRQVMIGEDKIKVLAKMIRSIEKEQHIIFPFESIRMIAKKNNFTEDEIAELEVMYF